MFQVTRRSDHRGDRETKSGGTDRRRSLVLCSAALVVSDQNRGTGRTLLRVSAATDDPACELLARAEDDFSAHAAAMARQWQSLSIRARERGAQLRVDRSPDGTEYERRLDMALVPQDEAHAIAEPLRDTRSGSRRAGDSLPHSTSGSGDGRATSSTAPAKLSLRSRSAWLWT